jgi:hypothetical protein
MDLQHLNRIRNFVGSHISGPSTWSSSLRIGLLPQTSHHWRPHLSNCLRIKVLIQSMCFRDLTFSLQDVWTMDELTSRVGSVDRNAALKALVTWVDLGVLKEDKENTFTLLEMAEEVMPGKETLPRGDDLFRSCHILISANLGNSIDRRRTATCCRGTTRGTDGSILEGNFAGSFWSSVVCLRWCSYSLLKECLQTWVHCRWIGYKLC